MLILGTAQFGLNYGINNSSGKVNLNEVYDIFEYAFENGIQTLDTASVYGNAHEIIGGYHSKSKIKFNVITKLADGSDLTNLNIYVSEFLHVLNINSIKTLMFHNFQDYERNLDIIKDLKKYNTNIEKLGVSVYTNEEAKIAAMDNSIDLIQMPYNLLDNFSIRGDVLKLAKSNGKTVHTRSAFLQGLFCMDQDTNNINYLNVKAEIQKLKIIASDLCYTIEELALIYCLNNSYSDGVIIGVDTKEQLKKNVKCLNIKLSESVIETIENIVVNNVNIINPKLWV